MRILAWGLFSLAIYSETFAYLVRNQRRFPQLSSLPLRSTLETQTELDKMNVQELRLTLRKLGGIPGVLRKNELVDECRRLNPVNGLKMQLSTTKATATAINPNNDYNILQDASSSAVPLPVSISQVHMTPEKSSSGRSSGMNNSEMKSNQTTSTSSSSSSSFSIQQSSHTSSSSSSDAAASSSVSPSVSASPPIASTRHPLGPDRDLRLADLQDLGGGQLEVVFLGTASCIPSASRGVSSIAMRYVNEVMIFDVGEGTQIQLQRSKVKINRIRSIFLSHLHGDHVFGLPGLLCIIGQARLAERSNRDLSDVVSLDDLPPTDSQGRKGEEEDDIIDIYGPEGTRALLRAQLQLTAARIAAPYRVHELKDVPLLPYPGDPSYARSSGPSASASSSPPSPLGSFAHPLPPNLLKRAAFFHQRSVTAVLTKLDPLYGERTGGRDIYPDPGTNGLLYTIQVGRPFAPSTRRGGGGGGGEGGSKSNSRDPVERPGTEHLTIRAGAMTHSIPCLGYVVSEPRRPGALKIEAVQGLVEANKAALDALPRYARRGYRSVYQDLKALAAQQTFTFPDGQQVTGREINEPPRRGRKVVIMGDTCDGSSLQGLAHQASLVIHEATNAFIPFFDAGRYRNYHQLERETICHGHSTPEMAGRFAATVQARRLCLTHFSARYIGEANPGAMKIMWYLEDCARRAAYQQLQQQQQQGGQGQPSTAPPLFSDKNDVLAAWDLMTFTIPIEEELSWENSLLSKEEEEAKEAVAKVAAAATAAGNNSPSRKWTTGR